MMGRAAGEPATLVLTHVTVIDATGTPAQPDMTLVIAGRRIQEVGKAGEVETPTGARVVNAAGKFLIPGLWDMHVHWYDEPSLALFMANGVTGVRIMFGFPRHLHWRFLQSGLGPRLVIAGPVIDGPKPVWPDSLTASNEVEARQAVRDIQQAGYDFVKVYHLLPRNAYFAVADEANARNLNFCGHVPLGVSVAEASDAGQKSIEHLNGVALACSSREAELRRLLAAAVEGGGGLDPALLLRFEVQAADSYDASKAEALFARFAKNGTWHVPTLAVMQSHALLSKTDAISAEQTKYMPASLRARWESRRRATFKKLRPEDFANFERVLRKHLELVGAMQRAGVCILAGTDTGALDCYPGISLHRELQLLVKAGLTPMEALQTATRNPARYLGRANELGTVERGKLADLILLDADPLDDIRNTTKIHAVVANGNLLGKGELAAILQHVETACKDNTQQTKPPGAYRKYP
jgi:imidazolonepropionase-like amidohydrolase